MHIAICGKFASYMCLGEQHSLNALVVSVTATSRCEQALRGPDSGCRGIINSRILVACVGGFTRNVMKSTHHAHCGRCCCSGDVLHKRYRSAVYWYVPDSADSADCSDRGSARESTSTLTGRRRVPYGACGSITREYDPICIEGGAVFQSSLKSNGPLPHIQKTSTYHLL